MHVDQARNKHSLGADERNVETVARLLHRAAQSRPFAVLHIQHDGAV